MWWKLGEIWRGKTDKPKSYNRMANLSEGPEELFSDDEMVAMYKAKLNYLAVQQKQFPHCNQYVLHSPGVCDYCDKHPDWQLERLNNKVTFTGTTVIQNDWMQCPADALFNMSKNRWHGNQPAKDVKDITNEPL